LIRASLSGAGSDIVLVLEAGTGGREAVIASAVAEIGSTLAYVRLKTAGSGDAAQRDN